jgi:hypothetical protein
MNNSTIQIKIKNRLNKLSSNDYDNIECWQIVEAFNKGQVDWCRRNLHGLNVVKEGDEQSTSRIDDLQVLLEETTLTMLNKDTYYETVTSIPAEYLRYKRISVMATNSCCPGPRRMVVFLAEQGNVDILLKDVNKKPNFDWAETFATFAGDKLQVYTNGEFEIDKVKFTYYRQPIKIQINGCVDPYTQVQSIIDVQCEFKDDLVELLIDEAAKIIAGDIESMVQMQRNNQSVEGNN